MGTKLDMVNNMRTLYLNERFKYTKHGIYTTVINRELKFRNGRCCCVCSLRLLRSIIRICKIILH